MGTVNLHVYCGHTSWWRRSELTLFGVVVWFYQWVVLLHEIRPDSQHSHVDMPAIMLSSWLLSHCWVSHEGGGGRPGYIGTKRSHLDCVYMIWRFSPKRFIFMLYIYCIHRYTRPTAQKIYTKFAFPILNPFSAGTVFRRQSLTSTVLAPK